MACLGQVVNVNLVLINDVVGKPGISMLVLLPLLGMCIRTIGGSEFNQ